jgi:LmbE family N-acetylglucosaminyl deacetylase
VEAPMTLATLVVSPHADDEVLGCSAVLGPDCHVLYVGVDDFHRVSRRERELEVSRVADFFGFSWEAGDLPVNRYDQRARDVIRLLEAVINERQPHTVFLPVPSYNQDHRVVHQSGLVAVRHHDSNHFAGRVLLYEGPDNFLLPIYQFTPNCFVRLDLARKLAANDLHASQRRGHRSPEILSAMATYRGLQAAEPAAEAYEILRWVLPGPGLPEQERTHVED